jgi:prevent-host-death family protein
VIHYVSVYDIKVDLSKYLKHIEKGDEVVITKHGKAVAKLIPYTTPGIKFGILSDQGLPELDPEDISLEKEIAVWRKNLDSMDLN